MHTKAVARFFYANVPGLAAARFAAKDFVATYAAKPEFAGVSRLSISDGLIVDVGANRGQSIGAFRRFAPKARIAAFEPEPASVERLKARHGGHPAVTVHGCALAAASGEMTLFVPRYGHWHCDGMPATDYAAATDWLRDPGRMFAYDETKLTVEEHAVECRTLDSFGLAPQLVKLHAQGAELEILNGARETMERHRPALMVAFVSDEVHRLLDSWGYRPYDYRDGQFRAGMAERPRTFTWYLTQDHSR